jgi:Peptidyl-prolyl cis-trans isomerase (rotamase) - cyclophilin family
MRRPGPVAAWDAMGRIVVTSSNRRERELARAKFERQQQRRVNREEQARSRQRIIAIVVIAALVVAGGGWAVLTLLGDSSESTSAAESSNELDEAVSELAEELSAQGPIVDGCTDPVPARADDISFDSAPAPGTEQSGTLTLATNCGDIVIDMFGDLAPETVASAAFLADTGFYDATACHRLTTAGIFVVQCGDPAGDGTGGPGYVLPDENLPAEGQANYPAGTVAMANAGPGTAGSQFFLVYEDTTLPSGYTIWGQVSEGLDILRSVADAGVADGSGDGLPAQPLVIESATVSATCTP